MDSTNTLTRLLLHLHPQHVSTDAIRFNRTFGLGGIAALLFVLLCITGLALRFTYVPSETGAYDSLLDLQNRVIIGHLLRNLHHWSAMAMVIVTFLHLLRVFYSRSIYHTRGKNWLYGLLLIFLVVLANFTGYLLPWDQLSFWAVTIMTNMLGYFPGIGQLLADMVRDGNEVTEATLLRFYQFHTGLLPLLLACFMAVHFWLIRKAHGVAVPEQQESTMVPSQPYLLDREKLTALLVLIALLLLSIFADAPLLDKANSAVSPNPSKAPWYFMGFQELLLHVHPLFGIFVIPFLVLTFLIAIPKITFSELPTGLWFSSKKEIHRLLASLLFAIVLTSSLIFASESWFDLHRMLPQLPVVLSTGLLMCLVYFIPVTLFLLLLKRYNHANRIDLVRSLFTIIITSYIVMTVIGSVFRGEGMRLFL